MFKSDSEVQNKLKAIRNKTASGKDNQLSRNNSVCQGY